MIRYLRTTYLFWSTSIAAEMEYRANFVTSLLHSLMTLGGAILTLKVFYQHDYQMGDWTWPQALAVVAFYTILEGFQSMLLSPNRTRVTEHVREGTLDFVLLKPIDSQFWLSTRMVSLWGLPNVILGLIILCYAGGHADPPLGLGAYLRGILPIALAMVVLYSVGFILGTLTIWFVKLYNITIAMQALLEAGRFPIPAYPLAYRIFFTFVLPVAFMTTVPAAAILGMRGWEYWLTGSAVVAIVLLAVSRWFWHFALRYYTSASS